MPDWFLPALHVVTTAITFLVVWSLRAGRFFKERELTDERVAELTSDREADVARLAGDIAALERLLADEDRARRLAVDEMNAAVGRIVTDLAVLKSEIAMRVARGAEDRDALYRRMDAGEAYCRELQRQIDRLAPNRRQT